MKPENDEPLQLNKELILKPFGSKSIPYWVNKNSLNQVYFHSDLWQIIFSANSKSFVIKKRQQTGIGKQGLDKHFSVHYCPHDPPFIDIVLHCI